MKLHGQHGLAPIKGLVRRQRGGGQQARAFGQVEGVAMPVERGTASQVPQRRVLPGIRQGHGRPADFLGLARIDARAQGRGDDLRAQADAQRGPHLKHTLTHGVDLGLQPRVKAGVVDTDGAAQHHQQIGPGQGRRVDGLHARVQVLDVEATLGQHGGKDAQILKRQVANNQTFHERSSLGGVH